MGIMLDDFGYGLSKRRVTLSTAGVVPSIGRLLEDCDVSLAVSLHAPDDELRNELVPLNRKYPISELLQACKEYVGEDRHARQLAGILEGVPAKINLIPFNPFPETRYKRSPDARIDRFFEILNRAGIVTITRRTRGDDIDAACGQLAGQFMDRTRRRTRNQLKVEVGQL